MKEFKIAHLNANGIFSHKNEIEHSLESENIDILLVTETHLTSKNFLKVHGHSIYSGNHRGGVAVIVRSSIQHYPTVWTTVISSLFNCQHSVFCPPKHKITVTQFDSFYKKLGPRFIAAGYYIAKLPYWRSRLTSPKGKQLIITILNSHLSCLSDVKLISPI